MTNFITIVKIDGDLASYQVQNVMNEAYFARLIKSTTNVPDEIKIEKDLSFKNGSTFVDSLTNKLICTIKINNLIDNNVSQDFLS